VSVLNLLRSNFRTLRYAIVGVLNTSVDIAVFSLGIYWLDLPLLLANTMAFLVAVTQSFILNRFWTFSDYRKNISVHHQWLHFILLNVVGLGLSSVIIWSSADLVTSIGAKCAATILVFIWGYNVSKRFVF